MTAYRELIERLEKATGPDRKLDAALANSMLNAQAASGYRQWQAMRAKGTAPRPSIEFWERRAPSYTASIDAALSLVEKMLPTWDIDIYVDKSGKLWTVDLADPDHPRFTGGEQLGQHEVGGIAICLSLLRALEAQSKDKEEGE